LVYNSSSRFYFKESEDETEAPPTQLEAPASSNKKRLQVDDATRTSVRQSKRPTKLAVDGGLLGDKREKSAALRRRNSVGTPGRRTPASGFEPSAAASSNSAFQDFLMGSVSGFFLEEVTVFVFIVFSQFWFLFSAVEFIFRWS
jgi:hypothetical protein